MHISHDVIATKICPSYEFLAVFGQVRVWDRKSAGRARVVMVCGAGAGWKCAGRERAKYLKLLRVWGGFKFCECVCILELLVHWSQEILPNMFS